MGSKSKVVCDALILDEESRSDTYPYIQVDENDVELGHEATVSKIGEEQLFYLMSRGLSEAEASAMIVVGLRRADHEGAPARVRGRDEPADPAADGRLGRLIDAERVDFIAVPTLDQERSVRFYGETLGLPRNPKSSDRWVEFETPNVTIAILPHRVRVAPSLRPAARRSRSGRRRRRGTAAAGGGGRRVSRRARSTPVSVTSHRSPIPTGTSLAAQEVRTVSGHRRRADGLRRGPVTDMDRAKVFYGETLGLPRSSDVGFPSTSSVRT